jgi:hypothetical protein
MSSRQAEKDRTVTSSIDIKQLTYSVQIRTFGSLVTQMFIFENPYKNFNINIPRGGKRHFVSAHVTGNYKIISTYRNNTFVFNIERELKPLWEYKILQPPEQETVKLIIMYASVVKYHKETRTDLPAVNAPVSVNVQCIYKNAEIQIWNNKKLTHRQDGKMKLVSVKPSSCVLVVVYDETIQMGKSVLNTPTGEIIYIDAVLPILNTPRTRIATNPLSRQPTLRHIIGSLPPYGETSSQVDLLLAHFICDIYNNNQHKAERPPVDWFRVGENIKHIGYDVSHACTYW